MTNRKIKKLNLGFEIGDKVTTDDDELYYNYSQFVKRYRKYAPYWQYKRWIKETGLPLTVIGVHKHVDIDLWDNNKYCVVVQDRDKRIYLVGEKGVKKNG